MGKVKSNMSKEARILRLFKEKKRLTQKELNRISYRYGAIIYELRKEGNSITTVPIDVKNGHYEYVYKRPYNKKDDGTVLGSHDLYFEENKPKHSNYFLNAMQRLKKK